MSGSRVSQSVSAHHRRGGLWYTEGVASVIVIGMWSDPVEGRKASPPFTRQRSRGFEKARSMTEGRSLTTRGNLVYSPRVLGRAKPDSTAFSKYEVEHEISRGEKSHRGSERMSWMLRPPTTSRGNHRSGKRPSGGTEWIPRSTVLVELALITLKKWKPVPKEAHWRRYRGRGHCLPP